MATTAPGRVTCPKCGANNFETQAACWKCSAPLLGGAGTSAVRHTTFAGDGDTPAPLAAPTVDPSVAHWVGIIGGLLLPLVMLPVGFAFLMWDDRRKVEVGRTATIASLVGTLLHGIVTYYAVAGLVSTGMKLLPGAAQKASAARSEPAPDMNSEAKPLDLSGIKPMVPAK